MAQEIERKFLTRSDAWRTGAPGVFIRQGYLSASATHSVRVRAAKGGMSGGVRPRMAYGLARTSARTSGPNEKEWATLTVKGEKTGPRAAEFEYPIPLEDALEMLAGLCPRPLIEKTRHNIPGPDGRAWDVDEFHRENDGLVVAEIELSREDEEFARPSWLGEEVTGDPRYLNSNLAERPFATWDR